MRHSSDILSQNFVRDLEITNEKKHHSSVYAGPRGSSSI